MGEVHRLETEPVPTPPLSTWVLIVLETPSHLRAATHTTVQVNILTFRRITKKFKSIIFKETTIFFLLIFDFIDYIYELFADSQKFLKAFFLKILLLNCFVTFQAMKYDTVFECLLKKCTETILFQLLTFYEVDLGEYQISVVDKL